MLDVSAQCVEGRIIVKRTDSFSSEAFACVVSGILLCQGRTFWLRIQMHMMLVKIKVVDVWGLNSRSFLLAFYLLPGHIVTFDISRSFPGGFAGFRQCQGYI